MKTTAATFAAFILPGQGLQFLESASDSPVDQVVTLLGDLKTGIEADGVTEQTSYDKFACWCEDTLAKKAEDITTAKNSIEELRTRIVKLGGELGSHRAEIIQLGKDVAQNKESQKEATEIREKETEAYEGEKAESEQCIGALEAAVGVLKGAGTKPGFLATIEQAQLLSVVAGVRGLLHVPAVEKSVGSQDMQVVREFVDDPSTFISGKPVSAMQVASKHKNPYGDYAPRSTQIQGILKEMYGTFAKDLERANVDEAKKQKGFEELMVTKRQELATLELTLKTHESDKATKGKALADGKVELQDTVAQLEADEAFFGDTKQSCSGKAQEWAQRTRMRTEELAGINQAVAILSSDEAKATFANATNSSFMQLEAEVAPSRGRTQAYSKLKQLAGRYNDLNMAQLAVRVKTSAGGHFDQIMVMIDGMVARCREEGKQDIEERDWCEAQQGKNTNDMEDLNRDITKAGNDITRMNGEVTALDGKLTTIQGDINTTKTNQEDLLDMRVAEQAAFSQGVKDDTKAIELLETAIRHLGRYYSFAQGGSKNSTADPDTPPEVAWKGTYNKRGGEGKGVVAILSLIKENLKKEINVARQADAESQANFESDRQALETVLRAQTKSEVELGKEKADLGLKIVDRQEFETQKGDDLTAETNKSTALQTNCAWVASHFDTRRTKRQAEIQGLIDAKNYLAGVDSD